MSKSKWIVAVTHLSILLTVLFGVISVASAQSPRPTITGTIRFADGSLCYQEENFFGTHVSPTITYVNSSGVTVVPPAVQGVFKLGLFTISEGDLAVGSTIKVTCEGTSYEHTFTASDLSQTIAIVLPNRRPVAGNIVATYNGRVVTSVPPGTTVEVAVSASDPDGDPMQFLWQGADGNTITPGGPKATWTLPAGPAGLHFMYALISDGKGGYLQKQLALATGDLKTPRGNVPLDVALTAPTVPSTPGKALPSDHTPATNHFLAYMGLDTKQSACDYYTDLGLGISCQDGRPGGLRFEDWKAKWAFGSSPSEASAKYANLVDLNLQRDMHTVSSALGIASYVCNYPNEPNDPTLSNVIKGKNLVACVAFEYSVTPGHNEGKPFTKFLTFGPSGDLLPSVNLDGRGEKYLPGACSACHGGASRFSPYPKGNPDLDAKFIPYDLDNYQFSPLPGYTRRDQEAQLHALNRYVQDANPSDATRELIDGWYANGAFDGGHVPAGWQGPQDPNNPQGPRQEDLYRGVVKQNCRMCHLSLGPSTVTPANRMFDTYANWREWEFTIRTAVCGQAPMTPSWYQMPNARRTFDLFWASARGPKAQNAPAILEQHLNLLSASPAPCKLQPWLP